jgi:hypothetical protein
VYQHDGDHLLLIEVKWPMVAASERDIKQIDRVYLEKGITQARKVASFVRSAPNDAAGMLFPERAVHLKSTTHIATFVVSGGHPGTVDVPARDVPILSYTRLKAYLDKGARLAEHGRRFPLQKVVDDLHGLAARPQRGQDYHVETAARELAGYTFRYPVIMIDVSAVMPHADPSVGKVGRNAPCPCGSGKKYKFCHGGRRP